MLTFPVETVIFDLDGTLRHNIPSADDVQYNFSLQLGIGDILGEQVKGTRWAHYYWAQSPDLSADMDRFGEMNADFWRNYSFRYLRSLDLPPKIASDSASSLYQHMEEGFKPMDHVYPCVPKTLQALKAAGYTLGLVSNRSHPCQEQCEQLGLLQYFDFAYVAAEVDAWKPDPRIFNRALEITQTTPERTVYIGDNFFADIIGSQNAGLQPVLLDPNGVFPDADCTVISTINELGQLLQ
jgi:HAD superfamily hydrolase (TIGR01549 family)